MTETAREIKYSARRIEDLHEAAAAILNEAANYRVFALYGDMGAGKTTFMKAVGKVLEISDHVTSPTFTIVNEYETAMGDSVFHFDFYRIKLESEAFDLGFENYLCSGNFCFIEWPEKVGNLLPEKLAIITIEGTGDLRTITLKL